MVSTSDHWRPAMSDPSLFKRLSGNSGRQFQSVCRHASVMEGRPAMSREFAQHQMDVAQVEHRRTRLGFPLIVFAMAPRATMPGVGTLHHPTFLYGREAFGPFWPRLHLNVPRRAMFAHPCEQRMIVILVVGKDRFKTGKIVWLDQPEQVWGGDTIIQPCTRDQHDNQ